MNIKSKNFYVCLFAFFFTIPSAAMFKPSIATRYLSSLKLLKSRPRAKLSQMNVTKSYLQDISTFSKKNHFNSQIDWRGSLPFFGAGLFLKSQLDDEERFVIEKLNALGCITDEEIKKVLATNDGRQAVVNYFLSDPLKKMLNNQEIKLMNKLLESNPKMSSQLIPFALENFKELAAKKEGRNFLMSLVKNSDKAAEAVAEHLLMDWKFIDNNTEWALLGGLFNDEKFSKNIVEHACNNFSLLIKDFWGKKILEYLVQYCVAYKKDLLLEKLADAIAENFDISLNRTYALAESYV